MTKWIYIILISLSTLFGILINSSLARYTVIAFAIAFEITVILVSIIMLIEVFPTALKRQTRLKSFDHTVL